MPHTAVAIKPRTDLKAPSMFKVIYVNDNKTTFKFVIESLMEFFSYHNVTAEKIAGNVNTEGSAVVAVLPFEIAEQKGIEVTVEARNQGFPLQIRIEKEEA